MARAEVSAQLPGRETMPVLVWTALGADGIKFKNTGAEEIIVRRNADDASAVTVATNVTTDGLSLPNLSVTMAAGNVTEQFKRVGPFPMQTYNQPGGWVNVDSGEATDKIAILQMALAK
jgi:hypothetical protein